MQKQNIESVESVMMPIPLDLLEEAEIDMYTPIQMYISHGRIVIQALEEDPFADEPDCVPYISHGRIVIQALEEDPFADEPDCVPCRCPRCRAHTREGCPG